MPLDPHELSFPSEGARLGLASATVGRPPALGFKLFLLRPQRDAGSFPHACFDRKSCTHVPAQDLRPPHTRARLEAVVGPLQDDEPCLRVSPEPLGAKGVAEVRRNLPRVRPSEAGRDRDANIPVEKALALA